MGELVEFPEGPLGVEDALERVFRRVEDTGEERCIEAEGYRICMSPEGAKKRREHLAHVAFTEMQLRAANGRRPPRRL